MAILGYQDNLSRMSVQNLALFKYFLIPFAIFLTVVPAGILSLTQQHQQNQNVVTFTTIISQEFPQEKFINGDTSGSGVVLTPNLTLSGDFVCVICAWIIALIGIFGFLRNNNLVGQFVSVFLIAFTVLQTFSAISNVIFSDQWIFDILNGSWQKTYLYDSDLIKEIQYEFSCKGFVSVNDRPVNVPHQFDESCSKMLINRFGTQLFDMAKIILLARFVQLFGVLLHAHIFNRVILQDITMTYAEEYDAEYFYDDKEYYNDYNDYISDSSDDLEEEDDDQNNWIDSPTSRLILSKIYFGEQQTS
ncbi:hypothetical protein C1645_821195 [Glomus cerebriforme]|uniref:Uncharacterized protein n=1 Tax=Glomus cerebriforme TaxID=658196 RepID=A0A397T737_9GLOM|nr:hypothetical protein C1645_832967 [Glomus cerebriforme]RIA92047.1 hypothetical protein C1645_821195 [Glomus cerebriforme]